MAEEVGAEAAVLAGKESNSAPVPAFRLMPTVAPTKDSLPIVPSNKVSPLTAQAPASAVPPLALAMTVKLVLPPPIPAGRLPRPVTTATESVMPALRPILPVLIRR